MRASLVAALLLVAAMPVLSRADISAPHDKADTAIACYYCHSLAVRTGVSGANFNSACLGCHNQPGHAFGTPWLDSDQAVPGVTGNSHNWSGPGASPEHGAIVFLGYIEKYNWAGGNLQCIVCHEVHKQAPASADSMHTSIPVGVPQVKTGTTGALTGTATMTLTAVPGSAPEGFRLKILTVGGGGGTFILSHDHGFNPDSWFNWVGGAWVAGTAAGPGRPFTDGVDVPLDIPGISVRWSAGAVVGDYWDFYVGYPFLRYTNTNDGICIGCHQERVMDHLRARGVDRSYLPNGIRKFSHPVGVGLNANGFGTDRTTILDVDGTEGSSTSDGLGGVANATNDLVLKGGVVRCTTCHAAHNTDSNSLTIDVR